MSSHDAFAPALAAYVLDALEATERRAFEAHLATCAECRAELVDLRRAATALAAGVDAVEPPASLKAKTIARATGPRATFPAATGRVTRSDAPTRPRAVLAPYAWLGAAAAVVCVVGLGAYALALRGQVATMRESLAEATARVQSLRAEVVDLRRDSVRLNHTLSLLNAPTVMRVDLRGQGTGAPAALGRAYLSGPQGVVFAASGLPVLGPDRIYQVWVFSPTANAPISAGVFPVNENGNAVFSFDLPPGGEVVKAVAVTLERGPNGAPGAAEGPVVLLGTVGG